MILLPECPVFRSQCINIPEKAFFNDVKQIGEGGVLTFVTLEIKVCVKHPFCITKGRGKTPNQICVKSFKK